MTTPANAATRKPKVTAYKYERFGSVLAIAPKAFFESYFFYDDPVRENTVVGEAVIVDIRDPLEQRSHYRYDSYEDILNRVRAACATPAAAVILRFDSPGGEAAGCFESAREVRAICDAAGKQLHAYVEGDCCSAAYAFASACHSVTVGETSISGSIGVLVCRYDYSAQNEKYGMRVAFVTSGARKADGHPDNPITDAEIAALQPVIDAMGSSFFAHVANTRGVKPEAVALLEAKIFDGAAAVAAGLADEVGTLQTVLARIASGGVTKGPDTMAASYEKARAALEEVAKGEDANAKAAQAALAAMDAIGGGAGDGDTPPADDDDDKEDDAGDAGAAGDPPPAGDPKKDDDAKAAAAAATRVALKATSDVAKLRAELKVEREKNERRELIASRPGMDEATVALLEKAPIELVREHVKSLPETPVNPQLVRDPLRGQGQEVAGLDPKAKAELDARMGLTPVTIEPVNTPTRLVLSARGRKPAPTTPPNDAPN